VSTDFGPGTMTRASYPRQIRTWHRGTPLAEALLIREGTIDDVGA
jgi:prolyl oligopeptidase